MQLVTIKFDHVFDVVKSGNRSEVHTYFSFESDGIRQYGAKVQGHPTIKDGMTVTALLSAEGNWQSIVGWLDHGTGEILFDGWGYSVFIAVISLIFSGLVAIGFLKSSEHQIGWPVLVIAIGLITFAGVNLLRTWKEWRTLKALTRNSTPTLRAGQ
jgi:hypothetical protein